MAIREMTVADLRKCAEMLDSCCDELVDQQYTAELAQEVLDMTAEERREYLRSHEIPGERRLAVLQPWYN